MKLPQISHPLRSHTDAALSFLYPENCEICRAQRATPAEGFVCGECRQKIRFIKAPFCERCGLPFPGDITMQFVCFNCHGVELHFTSARSAVLAGDTMLDIIHRYKYKRALWFEPLLAGLLVDCAAPILDGGGWDAIVPVPLHPSRESEREFNQAGHLAQHLAAALRLPVNSRLLRRVEATRTQTLLSRAERARNVRHAFAPRAGAAPRGLSLIVIDDVLTTGATTNACARVLRKAGAARVCVWTVARGA